MFRNLIFLILLMTSSSAALAAVRGSLGAGMETRMQREVNPDYMETKALGQLFGQIIFGKWVAHGELGEERQESRTGALTVSSHSISAGLWGRRQFREESRWRPFVGTGIGSYFDRVTSEFNSSIRDERSGTRLFWGLGGGVGAVFWKHLLVEGEARATLVRDRREPLISALLRAGVSF